MSSFLWFLQTHRNFWKLSSSLTIDKYPCFLSPFLWTHRIFLWNLNSHRNFFENLSSNPIFSTGKLVHFFGAKKHQNVRDILTKIKHFHFPHLIPITSSTSHIENIKFHGTVNYSSTRLRRYLPTRHKTI